MVLTTIFIPIAVKLGFRDQQLIALLIMLGSPTTPSFTLWPRTWAMRVC